MPKPCLGVRLEPRRLPTLVTDYPKAVSCLRDNLDELLTWWRYKSSPSANRSGQPTPSKGAFAKSDGEPSHRPLFRPHFDGPHPLRRLQPRRPLPGVSTPLLLTLVFLRHPIDCRITNGRKRRAPWQGGAFQWVQGPPGDSLPPEAIGAVMEVTKWLKPSNSGHNW